MLFEWRKEYETGVEILDKQHQQLFEIANRAYALLKEEYRIDKYDDIVAIIQELKDYTSYHFTFEEKYMTDTNYKKYLSHKVEHEDFIAKINETDLDQMDVNQNKYLTDLLDFVMNWLVGHIIGRDKLYAMPR